MAGPNDKWAKPVELKLSREGKTAVAGPFKALAVLTASWPGEQCLSFVKARSEVSPQSQRLLRAIGVTCLAIR